MAIQIIDAQPPCVPLQSEQAEAVPVDQQALHPLAELLQDGVSLQLEADRPEAGLPDALRPFARVEGELLVTTSQLFWWSPSLASGLAIDYRSIMVHATSKDNMTGTQFVYAQVKADQVLDLNGQNVALVRSRVENGDGAGGDDGDGDDGDDVNENENGDGEGDAIDDDEDYPTVELRLFPKDSNALNAIYEALCKCASLHPDPAEDDDGEALDLNQLEWTGGIAMPDGSGEAAEDIDEEDYEEYEEDGDMDVEK